MGLYTVFSHDMQICYKTRPISKASIFVLLTTLGAISLPIIIAYRTGGLWKTHEIYFEQPHVTFTKQYLLIIETSTRFPLICSSLSLNDSLMNSEECSIFSFIEEDENFDGLIDNLKGKFFINLPPSTYINALTLLLIFDVKIFSRCLVQFQGLSLWKQIAPPFPFQGGLFHSDTYMNVLQHKPIDCIQKQYYNMNKNIKERNEKIFSVEDLAEGFEINTLSKEYYKNEMRTNLIDTTSTWINGPKDGFELTFAIQIAESQLNFNTTFWYIMKWAWIQYLCIAIVIFWIIKQVKIYLFTKQFLMSWRAKSNIKLD